VLWTPLRKGRHEAGGTAGVSLLLLPGFSRSLQAVGLEEAKEVEWSELECVWIV